MENTLNLIYDELHKVEKAISDQEKNNFKNVDLSVLEGKSSGLKLAIEIIENNDKSYQVIKVQKGSGNSRIVRKNLTRKEAQRMVQADIKENPNPAKSMLVFDKM